LRLHSIPLALAKLFKEILVIGLAMGSQVGFSYAIVRRFTDLFQSHDHLRGKYDGSDDGSFVNLCGAENLRGL